MDTLKLAQQLFRAAKRMKDAAHVVTGRQDQVYSIRVIDKDGAVFDITVKQVAD